METAAQERTIYYAFRTSILIKGAISAAEILVGGILFFISFEALAHFGVRISAPFLPDSLFAWVAHEVALLSLEVATIPPLFVALYIFSRGLIKLVLIAALLRNMLWAYPSSLCVMGAFLLYQFYQIAAEGSAIIVAITLFDIVVMYFIWREWRIVEAHVRKGDN